MKITTVTLFIALAVLTFTHVAKAQPSLIGQQYQVSLQNFPTDVGTTVDPETQLPTDHGTAPLTTTFDGEAETFGNIKISERVFEWSGIEGGIPAVQAAGIDGETDFLLDDWQNPGQVVEFSFGTADGSYMSEDDEAQGFATISGLTWANTPDGAVPEFYLNSWYIYYTIGDVAITGMEMQIPELGVLVGAHPFDETVMEVMYIAYGGGQVEDIVEPLADGGVDLYFGTSQLDAQNGSWDLLANAMGFSGIEFFNKFGDTDRLQIGFLVKPPFVSFAGDLNNDQILNGSDVDLLTAAVGGADLAFDFDGDLAVTAADRTFWIEQIAKVLLGDTDFNGSVQFPDFLALSANFGQNGGWAQGDFDGSGKVEFPDFLALSSNFGKTSSGAAPQSVPEPTAAWLLSLGVLGMIRHRRFLASSTPAG